MRDARAEIERLRKAAFVTDKSWQKLHTELAVERAKVQRVEQLAEFFQNRLPDGTGNGRAYNSYRVADLIRAALTGEESE